MKRHEPRGESWIVGAVLGGTALVGGVILTIAAWPRTGQPIPGSLPGADGQAAPGFTEADVEAAARMLASENARGSQALHVELIHTQLRACKPGQSLYARITAGSGWGAQGERKSGGGVRPVSTAEPATPALRQLAREVLAGLHPSTLPTARKFFEPVQQDRAWAIGARARQKKAAGLSLSAQEQRLIHYYHSAEEQRRRWLSDGAKYVGTIDGIEFYT